MKFQTKKMFNKAKNAIKFKKMNKKRQILNKNI